MKDLLHSGLDASDVRAKVSHYEKCRLRRRYFLRHTPVHDDVMGKSRDLKQSRITEDSAAVVGLLPNPGSCFYSHGG